MLTCLVAGCSPADVETRPQEPEVQPAPRIRVSAWYWLNSAPKNEWARDFEKMRQLGFTHVVVGWGLNSSAGVLRVAALTAIIAFVMGALFFRSALTRVSRA